MIGKSDDTGEFFNDFKFCKCGAVAVDGGFDYLRRCGNLENIEELSEVERGQYEGNI